MPIHISYINCPHQLKNFIRLFNLMSSLHDSSSRVYRYNPLHSSEKLKFQFEPYILIVLNRPILLPPSTFSKLWDGALQRTLVDGGADRWLSYIRKNSIQLKIPLPELICGDFDSISHGALEWFKRNDVEIVHTPDQDYTDFQKALMEISKLDIPNCKAVVVVCECGGRIDQLFSTLSCLSKVNRAVPEAVGYLLTSETLSWVLPSGEHVIEVPQWDAKFPCAILPFSSDPAKVSTTGLKWNLSEQNLSFGGLISSSNQVVSTQVKISTKSTILWSMGIESEEYLSSELDSGAKL